MQAPSSLSARPAILRPDLWKVRIDALFDRPILLLLTLVLARCVAFPYLGIIHDAQLYALQVSRRLHPEPFTRDLFFLHGSQDQYSLFSWLVAPIVSLLGLPITFFFLYVLSSTLFIGGQVRLVKRLVPDRWAGLLALMILAVGDLPYGGLQIFQVHEGFLTARLPAAALALWGLDQALSKRWLIAWGILVTSMMIHPLIALPALAIACWWWVEGWWPAGRASMTITAFSVVALGIVAGIASGQLTWMSAGWFETVYQISPQCFASQWLMADWIHLSFAVAGLVLSVVQGSTLHKKIARGTLAVGLGGLALTLISEFLPITLLLQVQSYRALWILELFAVPLGLTQASRLWREKSKLSRLLSVLLLFGLGRWRSPEGWDINLFWPYAGVVVLTFVAAREIFLPRTSPQVHRRWTSATWGLFTASLLVALLSIWPCLSSWSHLTIYADPLTIVSALLRATGNAIVLLMAGAILATVMLLPARLRAGSVLIALSIVLLLTGWARREAYLLSDRDEVAYVREELRSLPSPPGAAGWTIYWPTDVREIWFGTQSSSYYHFTQVQGAIFQEVTAREARRRLSLVKPFEFRRMNYLGPFATRDRLEPWLGMTGQGRPVVVDDLTRLASDPAIDLVILPYRVGDVPARSNGSLWIYDCREIRAAQGTLAHRTNSPWDLQKEQPPAAEIPVR
ncbi:hypothetical protein K2X85_16940 [bacterium]|nr:hypothetical protein [bacterium]